MKSNPLVSVIVPVYNVEKYLRQCLDSILGQTYKNLEVIIVDDGSTDSSANIIKEYKKKDDRIVVISQKNQGLSAARNVGIKKANGDYIMFVDSDDWIAPDIVEYLRPGRADVSICSHYESSEGKNVSFNKSFKRKSMNPKMALTAMLKEHGFMVSAWGKLYKKDLFKDVFFPVGKLHEDLGATYKLIMAAKKIVFLPEPKYYYRQREDSIIHEFDERKFDIVELTDEMCDNILASFPELKNVTNERRMRARFSLLRQIPNTHPRKRELVSFLRKNKKFITKNPEASSADKIGLLLATTSTPLFKFAYELFK